mmetsp:Transcript_33638/g.89188  ORF Transcript_33638/g.89188 Transcript_33638/m.89188 type:complete len:275 (+) Transcript_33638:293-1117(+)
MGRGRLPLRQLQHPRPDMHDVGRQQGDRDEHGQEQLRDEPLVAYLELLSDDVERDVEGVLPAPRSDQRDARCHDGDALRLLIFAGRVLRNELALDDGQQNQHEQADDGGQACEDHASEHRVAREEQLEEGPVAPEQVTPGNQHDEDNLDDVDPLVRPVRAVVLDVAQHREQDGRQDGQAHGPPEHEPDLPGLVLEMGPAQRFMHIPGNTRRLLSTHRFSSTLQEHHEEVEGRVDTRDRLSHGLRDQEGDHQAEDVELELVDGLVHLLVLDLVAP